VKSLNNLLMEPDTPHKDVVVLCSTSGDLSTRCENAFGSSITAIARKRRIWAGYAVSSSTTRVGTPREMSGPEVQAFLNHLATERRVSASTQNQALSAILFLYREVLEIELPWLDDLVLAKRPERLPVVLTR